jgi:hypothetical protein
MIRKNSITWTLMIALALLASSCHKYNYYYRDQKDKDCTKQTSKSHRYKK